MLSISCTVPFVAYTATIVNGTDRPVDVGLRVSQKGRGEESTSTTLPPGGSIERTVSGNPAGLLVEASLPRGEARLSLMGHAPVAVVTDTPDGFTLEARPAKPKETAK
jgi:hypothetical protein